MMQLLTVLGCLFLVSCTPAVPPHSSSSSSAVSSSGEISSLPVEQLHLQSDMGDDVPLTVEIARTDEDRARGLMYRTSLADDHGMLFVFDKPQELRFWMKNTKIPLEVFFFDQQGKFVSMQSMEPCTADPCPSYPSHGLAQYALEVNAGLAHWYRVGEGWSIDYVRDGPE